MLRFLRDVRRQRPVQPWRFAKPFAESLASLAELLHAIGAELEEPRWTQLAEALDKAADEIRVAGNS